MTPAEAVILLTYVARIDHRSVSTDDADAWAELLDDVPITAAMSAAREHLREDNTWLTPALIRKRLAAKRAIRPDVQTVDQATTLPDADPDDVRGYIAALRASQHRAHPLPLARPRPVAALLTGAFRTIPGSDL